MLNQSNVASVEMFQILNMFYTQRVEATSNYEALGKIAIPIPDLELIRQL